MEKIKVLFFTTDFKNYVSRNIYYFAKELAKHVDLTLWHQPGNIEEIISTIGIQPDFILINDRVGYNSPDIKGLSSVNIPKGFIFCDLHFDIEMMKNYIDENDIQFIFSIYRDAFHEKFPEYVNKMYWFPHFTESEIFKDYRLPKDINYLMMGAINFYYPLREKMLNTMKDEEGFVYHCHPGYQELADPTATDIYVGEKYAMELNRSKIFLTDDSIFHYPVKKYFEALACKTLLLASASKELEDLGFIPGINFVDVTEDNFLEKARYYLKNEKERTEIAVRGYEMVHARHNLYKRVQDFMDIIKRAVLK